MSSITHQMESAPVASPAVRAPKPLLGAYIAFAVICLFWGTTFLAIRVAIETVPTLLVSGIRFLIAGVILLVIALARRSRFPSTFIEWRDEIVDGVLMFAIANSLVVFAEHSLSSGLTALLSATIPIWMAVLESMSGTSSVNWRKSGALALGFGGVALLVAPAIGQPGISLAFFVAVGAVQLSAIIWNVATLHSKRRTTRADPAAAVAVQILSGGVVVSLTALMTGAQRGLHVSPRSAVAVLYLAVFGSVIAYSAYVYALKRLSAGKLSSYAYVNPAIAVVLGSVFLGETVSLRMIVGMGIILGGVCLLQMDGRVPAPWMKRSAG